MDRWALLCCSAWLGTAFSAVCDIWARAQNPMKQVQHLWSRARGRERLLGRPIPDSSGRAWGPKLLILDNLDCIV